MDSLTVRKTVPSIPNVAVSATYQSSTYWLVQASTHTQHRHVAVYICSTLAHTYTGTQAHTHTWARTDVHIRTSTFPSTFVITFHYLICSISSSIWLPHTIPISNCHTPAHHSASWLSSCLQGCRYCSRSHKCKTNPNSQLQRVQEADFVLYVSLWDDLQCKYKLRICSVCTYVCLCNSVSCVQ